MNKKVLITGGPTNEYVDEVMKITNMSSGKIATELATYFLGGFYDVTLLITKRVKFDIVSPHLKVVRFETTDELMKAIEEESQRCEYDIVIHSAAVADYKPEYSFRMEDMAKEISDFVLDNARDLNEAFTSKDVYDAIFNILTNPECKVNDSTKISSCEPHLTVKLGLTPKIIEHLREWFPNAYICGFKLLENVSEEELIEAAVKQIKKCNTDLVFANDLAKLRSGDPARLVVNRNGYCDVKVDGAEGIYHLLRIATE